MWTASCKAALAMNFFYPRSPVVRHNDIAFEKQMVNSGSMWELPKLYINEPELVLLCLSLKPNGENTMFGKGPDVKGPAISHLALSLLSFCCTMSMLSLVDV